jgi:hypothetical protein
MSAVQPVFRSRWGFHPCDYATFRKLKFLNIVYQRAVRQAHAWERWKRKDPHNRVRRSRVRNEKGQTIGYAEPVPIGEPAICPVFSRKVEEQRYGLQDRKMVTDGRWITTDYTAARKPVSDPGAIRSLHSTGAEIDELFAKARAWVEQQDVG